MTLGLDDIPELDFRSAYAHAYNTWIRDFCAPDRRRLRWAAVLPLADPDFALAELEWALDAGATTVMLSPIPTPNGNDLGSADLDLIWDRLAAADVPAVVHASNPGSRSLRIHKLLSNRVQWQMGVPFQLQLGVLHVIDGGVLERHRGLRVGFFEGDVGWLGHWLGRLDETYDKMALVADVPGRSALEQFRQQCVISGEPADRGLAATAELIGADRVLWASDWPHQDGAWPDPKLVLRDRTDLDDMAKRAIFVDGPAQFYGIDLDELLVHLGEGWSLDASIPELGPMAQIAVP
jgi:predicted TIM-barrel fold metal-dependent hydrolase